jgi:hypothetical protein
MSVMLNSVTCPAGVIRATSLVPLSSVTQMLPSGPAVIALLVLIPETVNSPFTCGAASAGAANSSDAPNTSAQVRRTQANPVIRAQA